MGCAASGTKEPSPPHDEAKQHDKYEEDPDEPLPEGEIGDCMLGVNVSHEICYSSCSCSFVKKYVRSTMQHSCSLTVTTSNALEMN